MVDWAYRIDPLRCISMHGITERYLSAQKADAAGFVRELLKDLQTKISTQFSRVSVVRSYVKTYASFVFSISSSNQIKFCYISCMDLLYIHSISNNY